MPWDGGDEFVRRIVASENRVFLVESIVDFRYSHILAGITDSAVSDPAAILIGRRGEVVVITFQADALSNEGATILLTKGAFRVICRPALQSGEASV